MSNAFSLIRGGRRSLVHSGRLPWTTSRLLHFGSAETRMATGATSITVSSSSAVRRSAAKPNSLVYLAGAPTGFTSPQSGLLKTDDDAVVHSMDLVFGPAWMEPIK